MLKAVTLIGNLELWHVSKLNDIAEMNWKKWDKSSKFHQHFTSKICKHRKTCTKHLCIKTANCKIESNFFIFWFFYCVVRLFESFLTTIFFFLILVLVEKKSDLKNVIWDFFKNHFFIKFTQAFKNITKIFFKLKQ